MLTGSRRDLVVLLFVCALVFWWRLGRLGLIDPDEPFYAQTASEMLQSRDWLTPRIFGHPQFEKPALFYWLSMASFGAWGRNEFAARVPGALFATLLVLLTYAFGLRAFNRRSAFLGALVLATSGVFAVTARIMLTDVVFAFFLCGSCFALWLGSEAARPRPAMLVTAFVFSALAVLTKGPLGFLIPALAAAAYRPASRRPLFRSSAGLVCGLLAFALIAVPWYAIMLNRYGTEYLRAFFVHENLERLIRAEHPANNRLYYYPAVFVIGSLPWLPALAVMLKRVRQAEAGGRGSLFFWCWILTSLAFFTLAQSKLPTYVLFLFAPLSLLIGVTLDSLLRAGFQSNSERGLALGAAAVQSAAPFAVLAVPGLGAWTVPAFVFAACLLLGLALLARRLSPGWVAASALGTGLLIICMTVWSAGTVEGETSAKAVAGELMRSTQPGDTVLTSAFLARGIHYYTGRPVSVLSNRARPFFSPHPLPIVKGEPGLESFVRRRGHAVCVMRGKEWQAFSSHAVTSRTVEIGDKVLAHLESP